MRLCWIFLHLLFPLLLLLLPLKAGRIFSPLLEGRQDDAQAQVNAAVSVGNIFPLSNILTTECQDCLDDPLGCIINPIADNPTNPLLLAAIGAVTFGGVQAEVWEKH